MAELGRIPTVERAPSSGIAGDRQDAALIIGDDVDEVVGHEARCKPHGLIEAIELNHVNATVEPQGRQVSPAHGIGGERER